MNSGSATISIIRDGHDNSAGYRVQIFNSDQPEPIAEYSAGDSNNDSQRFGTGEIPESRLFILARISAEGMMKEHGIEGPIEELED